MSRRYRWRDFPSQAHTGRKRIRTRKQTPSDTAHPSPSHLPTYPQEVPTVQFTGPRPPVSPLAVEPTVGPQTRGMVEEQAMLICRCEGVTLAELLESTHGFDVRSVRQLKLVSRAGMGICQGRICRPVVEAVAAALGLQDGPRELSTRSPVRPVDMDTLAGEGAQ